MFLTTKLAAIGTLLLQWGLRLVLANHCKMLLSPNDALHGFCSEIIDVLIQLLRL